ncbi:MAG: phospholipase D-like domain-containing protein [Nitrospirota bacterium]
MSPILKPGRNCWDIQDVVESGLLIDGRDYYREFYRAAKKARHYILISGWQFDSEVKLLRGDDEQMADGDVRFIDFLNSLCERNPELNIYILAWDFSFIFMLEREWLQEWIFGWETNERIHFYFDSSHPIGASQHQKFVVVDGCIAFIGGMDICAHRWDDREHRTKNPERVDTDGTPYTPYHDVQAYVTGPIVEQLNEIFKARWLRTTGDILRLPPSLNTYITDIRPSVVINAKKAAFSRTQAKTLTALQHDIKEIRWLYTNAINAAEHLIYIENQYFSSQAVFKALVNRMRSSYRPLLQIILMLPKEPQAFLEKIAVGYSQVKLLRSLKEIAKNTGHALGIYYPAPSTENGNTTPVYIHSKVLIVDDRFLCVGSANTTNRSLGLDAELNISWEALTEDDQALIRSIREVRAALLADHTATTGDQLYRIDGVVDFLNQLADNPRNRLRYNELENVFDNNKLLKNIWPDNLIFDFDPDRPLLEEDIHEILSSDKNSIFAGGITLLKKWLSGKQEQPAVPQESSDRREP